MNIWSCSRGFEGGPPCSSGRNIGARANLST
jgi:hypothetical protein